MASDNYNGKELAAAIHATAMKCGFDHCGIVPVTSMDDFSVRLKERTDKVPDSAVFYDMLDETMQRFPWAKSIVVCSFWFGRYRFPKLLQGRYAKAFFLKPQKGIQEGYDLQKFEQWFSDQEIRCEGGEQFGHLSVAPLRYVAEKAGIGIIRKNNFFYTEMGSFNHLFGYVIDRDCELIHQSDLRPCSEKCHLCMDACPTKSLFEEYTMSPGRCVSFLTTFNHGIIPSDVNEELCGEWICGCDSCQDACPLNRINDWDIGESFSDLEALAPELTPEKLPTQSDAFLLEHVIPKTADHLAPSDIDVLRRNALRALKYINKKVTCYNFPQIPPLVKAI